MSNFNPRLRDAETREITLRPKGIRRYFFGVQLHSIPASK
jgi:hypothetical protein